MLALYISYRLSLDITSSQGVRVAVHGTLHPFAVAKQAHPSNLSLQHGTPGTTTNLFKE